MENGKGTPIKPMGSSFYLPMKKIEVPHCQKSKNKTEVRQDRNKAGIRQE
jgi:hypothetical protein